MLNNKYGVMEINPTAFSAGYHEILLKRLAYAVLSSIISQVVILTLFLLLVNIDVFHLREWFVATFTNLTSFNTILFLIPFLSIIFAQSVICAKDYVLPVSYCTTRFQKLFSAFSLRNFVILGLHIATGGLLVWLYLSVSKIYERNSHVHCSEQYYCIHEHTFLLITNGLWTGLYFYMQVYVTAKKLQFPVIQQRKLIHFKSMISTLLKQSQNASICSTLYFIIAYVICGTCFKEYITVPYKFNVIKDKPTLYLYVFMWALSMLYCFSMYLMQIFFNVFLTESIEFSLIYSEKNMNLQNAINMNNLPIVQHLASLDFYNLATWNPSRRQVLFSLSQPGGHPYNWNELVQSVLNLLNEYKQLLNKAVDSVLSEKPNETVPLSSQQNISHKNYSAMRNMSLHASEPINVVSVNQSHKNALATVMTDLPEKNRKRFDVLLQNIKKKLGYNFLFDELPESSIQKCLGNGQSIIWVMQGLASILSVSVLEDNYGVVQKDLSVIISTLTELKTSLDKLNKIPSFTKKTTSCDKYNYNMKLALNAAVKRSLINIIRVFGDYLDDFHLKDNVVEQLKCYLI